MITFRWWHNLLDMERKDEEWHLQDVQDELAELKEASGFIDRWSEYSDVVYTVTRGRWGGFNTPSPLGKWQFMYGSIYMFPKYSMRWLFFNRAGVKADSKRKMTEVRNPQKLHKLEHIANKYNVDSKHFTDICRRQLRYWPLLK